MKPIKEGRIGGTTSSNALPHADFVKVFSYPYFNIIWADDEAFFYLRQSIQYPANNNSALYAKSVDRNKVAPLGKKRL